ncbi:MAG: hypothetical protein UY96_C0003G0060 [Parcubacteria group bacterium GW2011_GWB1_56_8]|nr:MAG: hypothetical protein UY96_C0003G0060 [Parcubacteria group bacterium GW2011_GWB1_56_8]
MTPCTFVTHDALKADPERLRATCVYKCVDDFGFELLELYNCPKCNSTIALKGIGPVQE